MIKHIGHRVAPPRFILFVVVFAIGLVVAIPPLGPARGTMAAFDTAALLFLIAISTLLRRGEAEQMRQASQANDANRGVLLGLTGAVMAVILVAVAKELQGKVQPSIAALVVGTLALAWLFSNIVYALHYAHLYYGDADDDQQDDKGLDFPKCDEPDYWDFLYFSFTLGMTFQTSDVEISSRRVRRIALGHTMAAFVFNLGVIAFTINVLGGG